MPASWAAGVERFKCAPAAICKSWFAAGCGRVRDENTIANIVVKYIQLQGRWCPVLAAAVSVHAVVASMHVCMEAF
jgi:hypothetical protein